jgi:protein-tyrosine phosphatase
MSYSGPLKPRTDPPARIGGSEIIDGLYIGNHLNGSNAPADTVVLCVREGEMCRHSRRPPELTHWVPILDPARLPNPAVVGQLEACAIIIEQALKAGGKVLVHCALGSERSPLAVAWFLHRRRGLTFDEAYAVIGRARPLIEDRRIWLPPELL